MTKLNTSLLKALDILETLSEADAGLGISDLSERTGYPLSTTHRILATLMERGYIEQDEASNRYFIGVKILSLQSMAIHRRNISRKAIPVLNDLKRQLDATVNLGIKSEKSAIYLETVAADSSLSFYTPPGTRMPLYCTAIGKVLLAHLSPDARESLLETLELEPRTRNTITSLPALKAELERVNAQGWAIDEQEFASGIRCLATGIRDHTGEVVAAISATAIADRFSSNRLDDAVRLLTQAGAAISKQLGYIESRENE